MQQRRFRTIITRYFIFYGDTRRRTLTTEILKIYLYRLRGNNYFGICTGRAYRGTPTPNRRSRGASAPETVFAKLDPPAADVSNTHCGLYFMYVYIYTRVFNTAGVLKRYTTTRLIYIYIYLYCKVYVYRVQVFYGVCDATARVLCRTGFRRFSGRYGRAMTTPVRGGGI